MRLIDSHAHLQADAFASDAADVLKAAREAGLERFLVPGWDADSSIRAVELAAAADVDAAAGIHPHTAADATVADWETVTRLCGYPRVVAVGETGLDYDRGFSPRDNQLDNLRRHFRLARAFGKPVIIHCRSRAGERAAHDDLLRELAAAGAGTRRWPTTEGRPPGLLHSFSGPLDYAERALEMGLAVSFSGLVFRSTEGASAEVARLVPADRLLVETDSPYLSPPGAPKRRNEPAWVRITAEWLADRRGVTPESLGEQLVTNYEAIFHAEPAEG
jgi:TatD DNase family protein